MATEYEYWMVRDVFGRYKGPDGRFVVNRLLGDRMVTLPVLLPYEKQADHKVIHVKGTVRNLSGPPVRWVQTTSKHWEGTIARSPESTLVVWGPNRFGLYMYEVWRTNIGDSDEPDCVGECVSLDRAKESAWKDFRQTP